MSGNCAASLRTSAGQVSDDGTVREKATLLRQQLQELHDFITATAAFTITITASKGATGQEEQKRTEVHVRTHQTHRHMQACARTHQQFRSSTGMYSHRCSHRGCPVGLEMALHDLAGPCESVRSPSC